MITPHVCQTIPLLLKLEEGLLRCTTLLLCLILTLAEIIHFDNVLSHGLDFVL